MGLRLLLVQLALASFVAGTCNYISPDTSLCSSFDIGREVEIQFSNRGDADFDVFWLDQSMREVKMGKLGSWSEIGYDCLFD